MGLFISLDDNNPIGVPIEQAYIKENYTLFDNWLKLVKISFSVFGSLAKSNNSSNALYTQVLTFTYDEFESIQNVKNAIYQKLKTIQLSGETESLPLNLKLANDQMEDLPKPQQPGASDSNAKQDGIQTDQSGGIPPEKT